MIPRNSDRPTLVDVARESDVSLKTASRVLNNAPNIAPSTAKRVRNAMVKLGYRPNELARGLKGKRSAAIGMVVPNIGDPFLASAVKAVQEVAHANGHVVVVTSSLGREALEREEVSSLLSRQLDGLIIAPADGRSNTIEPFLTSNIPVVAFDRPMAETNLDTITIVNRAAAREATEHLLSHGYKSILTIGARPNLYTCMERVAGYMSVMKRARLTSETLLVEREADLTSEAINAALTGSNKVEAILTLNGMLTMMVLDFLKQLNMRIGKDVALISFDDFHLAGHLNPSLTAVRQPAEELGRKAAEILFARMKNPEMPVKQVTLPTTFQIRESCGCLVGG